MVKVKLVWFSTTGSREETVKVARVPIVGDSIDLAPWGIFNVVSVRLYAYVLNDSFSENDPVARVVISH